MSLTIASRLLSNVILFFVLAKGLGPESFGQLAFWNSVAVLLTLVTDYGFETGLVRRLSELDDPSTYQDIIQDTLYSKLLLGTGVMGLSFGFGKLWIGDPHALLLLMTLLFATHLNSFSIHLNLPFRALGRFNEETKVATFGNFLNFFLVGIVTLLIPNVIAVATAIVGSRAIYFIASIFHHQRHIGFAHLRRPSFLKSLEILRSYFFFSANYGLTTLYAQIDSILVRGFLDAGSLGIYQAGLKVVLGFSMAAQILGNVYLPRLTKIFAQNTVPMQSEINMLQFSMVALGSVGGGFILLAGPVMTRLFGSAYMTLDTLWPSLAILLFTRFLAASQGIILTSSGNEKRRMPAMIVAVVVLTSGSVLLTPAFGLNGMVGATAISVLALAGLYTRVLMHQKLPWKFDSKTLLLVTIAAFLLSYAYLRNLL